MMPHYFKDMFKKKSSLPNGWEVRRRAEREKKAVGYRVIFELTFMAVTFFSWFAGGCSMCAVGAMVFAIGLVKGVRKGSEKLSSIPMPLLHKVMELEYSLRHKIGQTLAPFHGSQKINKYSLYYKERQMISDALGFNYLEIRDISDFFEGWGGHGLKGASQERIIAFTDKTFEDVARYVEEKHITPYLYMLGRYPNKNKQEKVAA